MILSERVFGIRCLYIPAIVASRLATIAEGACMSEKIKNRNALIFMLFVFRKYYLSFL